MVRESRAGDDFHLLWAARRSLTLLDPGSDLKLVRLEGPNPDDDLDENSYLGCDLTEYFGGSTLNDANHVAFTQLKYSTLHATTKWTIATLTRVRKAGGASVMKRLAEMFYGLSHKLVPERRLNAVSFCLVSNQPLAMEVERLLAKVRVLLDGKPAATSLGPQRSKLTAIELARYDKLRSSSGLGAADFADFVRCLDLSGCGAESRSLQALNLGAEISQIAVGGFDPSSLLQLMRSQMLPETVLDAGLSRAHIIQALGASGEQSLFPYPPRIVMPAEIIATSQAEQLATCVAGTKQLILAHGGPGVGKTTTVSGLESSLPPGSVVCVFDCFANGQDLNPGEDRYSARSLIQIANEIALRTSTLPLVVPDSGVPDSVLWQRFQQLIAVASGTLPPGGLLVVAIDAADDAIYAAQRSARRCFVLDLWHIDILENVRIVMTARSARRDDVTANATAAITQVQLPAFDLPASSQMLRTWHSGASVEQCEEFHASSKGIARVQAYAIGVSGHVETGSKKVVTLDEALTRARLQLTEIFDAVLDTALKGVSSPAERRRQLAILAAMSRPANAATLAALLGGEERVNGFVVDLSPALQLVDGRVGFADAEFEHHLLSVVPGDDAAKAHLEFANYFMPRRETDSEAAQHLGQHLFLAGDIGRLVELVLMEGPPAGVADGFLRAQTFRQRAGFALHAAKRAALAGTATDITPMRVVQLLIAAGDAARVDTSMIDTVRQEPGLARLFADPSAIAQILLDDDSSRWRGAMHMRAAALLSIDPSRNAEAAQQIDLAHAWMDSWKSNGFPETDLKAEDVAHLVLAVHKTRGLHEAVKEIRRWTPAEFVATIGQHFFHLAPDYVSAADVRAGLTEIKAGSLVHAEAITVFDTAGLDVPVSWLRDTAKALDRFPLRGFKRRRSVFEQQADNWGVRFCEVALRRGLSRALVGRLLKRFEPAAPKYLSARTAARELDLFLRAEVLRNGISRKNLDLDQLAKHVQPDDPATDRDRSERNQRVFLQTATRLVPLMTHVATCLGLGTRPVPPALTDAASQLMATIEAQTAPQTGRTRRPGEYTDVDFAWYRLAVEALCLTHQALSRSGSSGEPLAAEILKSIDQTVAACVEEQGIDSLSAHLELATVLIAHQTALDLALDVLSRGAAAIEDAEIPARSKRDELLRAARIAYRQSPDVAAGIFRRAVSAASGLDADIGRRLRLVANIAENAAKTGPGNFDIAAGLVSATSEAWPYVDDPREQIPSGLILATATRLEARTGLAAAVRWYQQERIGLTEALAACLPETVATGAVRPAEAIALMRMFEGSRQLVATAAKVLKGPGLTGAAGRAAAAEHVTSIEPWIAMEGSADARERFAVLCEELGLPDTACAIKARTDATLLRTLNPDWAQREPSYSTYHSQQAAANERAEKTTLSTLAADLDFITTTHAGFDILATALQASGLSAKNHQHVQALDAVAAIAEKEGTAHNAPEAAVAIRSMLDAWRNDPKVHEWALARLPKWIEDHLRRLTRYVPDRDGYPVPTLVLPDKVSSLYPSILGATSALLDELDATLLYATASTLAVLITDPTERAQIASWALSPRHSSTYPGGTPPPPPAPVSPGVSVAAGIPAVLIWALLGHEDNRTRWRAMHAALLLLNGSNGVDIASELWKLAQASDGGNPVSEFYPEDQEPRVMSALQALHMVFAHVARRNPLQVRHLVSEFAESATSRSQPHAVIRALAQDSVDAISQANPQVISRDLLDEVKFANAPTSCQMKREHKGGSREAGETRFRFGYMDTIPYWLAPLGQIFHNTTTSDIAKRADVWITDRWGRTDDDTRADALRRGERRWELIHNDHGKLPVIESLQGYLEFHAMVTVAGELADQEVPMVCSPYDDDTPDSWNRWLDRYLPHSTSVWIAERLQPTPINSVTCGAWHLVQGQQTENAAALDLEGIDPAAVAAEILAAVRTLHDDPDFDVVSAWLRTTKNGWTADAHLHSALVTKSASPSLLAALSTFNGPITMPSPGDSSPHGNEIMLTDLQLAGWIGEQTFQDGPERHDPLGRNASSRRHILSPGFISFAQLTPNATHTEYLLPDRTVGARIYLWSEDDIYNRSNSRDPGSGYYVSVRRSLIDRYLNAEGYDLIVGAYGSFHPEDDYDRKTGKYIEPFRYWIHGADGRESSWFGQVSQSDCDDADD